MKYESEILYDLMKRDGLLNPSQDNLPYESELKEKYVNDVVGAYPKLQDYRPEWLNYNKCEYIPADFPTESQINQTSGTFENVVPYVYERAILKGNTLINAYTYSSFSDFYSLAGKVLDDNFIEVNADGNWKNIFPKLNTMVVKPDTTYTYIVEVKENTIVNSGNNMIEFGQTHSTNNHTYWQNSVRLNNLPVGITKFTLTTKSDFSGIVTKPVADRVQLYNTCTSGKLIFRVMVVEGDLTSSEYEKYKIPYFTGMQSVKLPVLTTTGKNLFDINQTVDGYFGSNGNISQSDFNNKVSNYIKVKPNTVYIYSFDGFSNSDVGGIYWTGWFYYNSQKEIIGSRQVNSGGDESNKKITFTTPSDCNYIRIGSRGLGLNDVAVQLELGSVATPYEPYKTNILTTSEEVELRGVGDVKDTLDCLTGEVTERIGEIVFDGSDDENWQAASEGDTINGFSIWKKIDNAHHKDLVCDKLSYFEHSVLKNDKTQFISCLRQSQVIIVNIKGLSSVDEIKQWLSENPITVQYKLATESIKTVDLSCINEDNVECDFIPIMDTMHYQTSSNTIPPLVDLTVCVEATTQNLASFVNLEGVEHDG